MNTSMQALLSLDMFKRQIEPTIKKHKKEKKTHYYSREKNKQACIEKVEKKKKKKKKKRKREKIRIDKRQPVSFSFSFFLQSSHIALTRYTPIPISLARRSTARVRMEAAVSSSASSTIIRTWFPGVLRARWGVSRCRGLRLRGVSYVLCMVNRIQPFANRKERKKEKTYHVPYFQNEPYPAVQWGY